MRLKIAEDDHNVPDLCPSEPDWGAQGSDMTQARYAPLRVWLSERGNGSWHAGLAALCTHVKAQGCRTPTEAMYATSEYLNLKDRLHAGLVLVNERYMGPTAVRLNALTTGLGMKLVVHMPGPDSIMDDLNEFSLIQFSDPEIGSLVVLCVAMAYSFDVEAIKYVCRNDRGLQWRAISVPVLEMMLADEPVLLDRARRWFMRPEGTGCDTPRFARIDQNENTSGSVFKKFLHTGPSTRSFVIPGFYKLTKARQIDILIEQELWLRMPYHEYLEKLSAPQAPLDPRLPRDLFGAFLQHNNTVPSVARLSLMQQLGASKETAQGQMPPHQTTRKYMLGANHENHDRERGPPKKPRRV